MSMTVRTVEMINHNKNQYVLLSLTALAPPLLAMTAKRHSAALNDRRENEGQSRRGRFDPQFANYDLMKFSFLLFVTVNVSSGLFPENRT